MWDKWEWIYVFGTGSNNLCKNDLVRIPEHKTDSGVFCKKLCVRQRSEIFAVSEAILWF